VYRPGQITFDGGTLQIAATIAVTSVYRGITIDAGTLSKDMPLDEDVKAVDRPVLP